MKEWNFWTDFLTEKNKTYLTKTSSRHARLSRYTVTYLPTHSFFIASLTTINFLFFKSSVYIACVIHLWSGFVSQESWLRRIWRDSLGWFYIYDSCFSVSMFSCSYLFKSREYGLILTPDLTTYLFVCISTNRLFDILKDFYKWIVDYQRLFT